MKLTVLSSISLLGSGALATPALYQRDVAAILGVLTDINAQVNALESAITATPLDPDSIVSQSNTLVSTIRSGTTTVSAQPNLNQIEALGLVTPTQDLADDTESTVNSLIGVKDAILELGEGCTTLESLQEQFEAASGLSDAVVSKVPEALADISKELADTIANAIQAGIDAYQGSCDGGNGGTPPPGSTTTTAGPTSTTKTACPAKTH
ncbi:hydrophobic surface binding protein A-domain-containing protein [Aspergillus karnatakaensis]|uniref:cell wall mannoprotein 1 family protein n=1 Tax=Aspergillus karnatakaensis TaxID=1810916 RepID=UPI003CCCD2D4